MIRTIILDYVVMSDTGWSSRLVTRLLWQVLHNVCKFALASVKSVILLAAEGARQLQQSQHDVVGQW